MMRATAVGTPGSRTQRETSMPSPATQASASSAMASSPTAPTYRVAAPNRAAAHAWLALLPPPERVERAVDHRLARSRQTSPPGHRQVDVDRPRPPPPSPSSSSPPRSRRLPVGEHGEVTADGDVALRIALVSDPVPVRPGLADTQAPGCPRHHRWCPCPVRPSPADQEHASRASVGPRIGRRVRDGAPEPAARRQWLLAVPVPVVDGVDRSRAPPTGAPPCVEA